MAISLEQTRGFTLLEMIVVLSIVGLISAIGFPKLEKMVARVEFATQKDDLANQLKLLSFKAYQNGKALSLKDAITTPSMLQLPSGWHLVSGSKITYSAIGICSGGEATFQSESGYVTYRMAPPFCKPITP